MIAHTKKVGFFEGIVDTFKSAKRKEEKKQFEALRELILKELDNKEMDKILDLLLRGMSLLFLVDRDYRANIRGFEARYAFAGQDGKGELGASAIFKTGWLFKFPKMIVDTEAVRDATVTVTFQDGRALAGFLLSPRPDIFSGILDNRLSFDGNLNYLLKFIYMARHVPKELGIELPPGFA